MRFAVICWHTER